VHTVLLAVGEASAQPVQPSSLASQRGAPASNHGPSAAGGSDRLSNCSSPAAAGGWGMGCAVVGCSCCCCRRRRRCCCRCWQNQGLCWQQRRAQQSLQTGPDGPEGRPVLLLLVREDIRQLLQLCCCCRAGNTCGLLAGQVSGPSSRDWVAPTLLHAKKTDRQRACQRLLDAHRPVGVWVYTVRDCQKLLKTALSSQPAAPSGVSGVFRRELLASSVSSRTWVKHVASVGQSHICCQRVQHLAQDKPSKHDA